MKVQKSGSWVLFYECVGFSLIILFAWLNELADLPRYLIGGGVHVTDWRNSLVETLVVLLIWAVVFRLTRRLLLRLHYLEGLLRVCAWCRKIGHKGQWMPLEQYFAEGFHVETTHGMCPDCLKKFEEDTTKFYRKELENQRKDPRAGLAA